LTQQEFVASLTEKDIMSVYSGVNGKCCCGCSGKHTTNPLYQAIASENRGYSVDPEECNSKTVKAILNKIKKNVDLMKVGDYQPGDFISVVIGKRDPDSYRSAKGRQKWLDHPGRLYVAYLLPTEEALAADRVRRAENKLKTAEAKVAVNGPKR